MSPGRCCTADSWTRRARVWSSSLVRECADSAPGPAATRFSVVGTKSQPRHAWIRAGYSTCVIAGYDMCGLNACAWPSSGCLRWAACVIRRQGWRGRCGPRPECAGPGAPGAVRAGANSGIGLATSSALVRQGHRVVRGLGGRRAVARQPMQVLYYPERPRIQVGILVRSGVSLASMPQTHVVSYSTRAPLAFLTAPAGTCTGVAALLT